MNKKFFSLYREPLADLPFLSEVQIESYKWFMEEGLKELFKEFSPIKDYSGEDLELEFAEFAVDEPKYDEYQAKALNLSFEAALRFKARLINKKTGEIKEQEIFLSDMPVMTPRGTFIVNGVERVVVSQLARSFGVYFTANFTRGRKLFGAKIIPSRGAWIEIETDVDNGIYARIDRKRKIPVSAILRMFGISSNEEILEKTKKADSGDISFMQKTLEKDPTKTKEEAYLEIYKRLRPGEPATADSAKELLDGMFSKERYDLSLVGRYKLNQRLGLPTSDKSENSRVISGADLINIISYIITLNNTPGAEADDIDHLGNRRIRSVGEMLQARLRVGMTRMKRTIQDRMSTLDLMTLTPAQLINSRPFMAVLREFFTTNQLSQFMNQINALSELEHLRRLSALGPGGLTRERAGFEVRDVHPSHYGRICPIETPEGPNIGLVVSLCTYARVNDFGFIETPYRVANEGNVSNVIKHLSAFEEKEHPIAQANAPLDINNKFINPLVSSRVAGEFEMIENQDVKFMDVSPNQLVSVSASLIPFLENDDANRALMGSNMQRQAVPLIKSEAPLVGTGMESVVARDSGVTIVADYDGVVVDVDSKRIVVRNNDSDEGSFEKAVSIYNCTKFVRSNQNTCFNHRPIVMKGEKVKAGQVIADGPSTEMGELALGKNVTVAFMPWDGYNYEDSILVSERLV